METPAHTPEATVPSETTLDPAVLPELASATEVADGMQSPPMDLMDPDNWELQLEMLKRAEEAAKNAPAVPEADAVTSPEAVAPAVATETTAGVAAEDDAATEAGDEKYGPQHRIRPRSETDAAVLKLLSRNVDMTLEEAIAKVKGSTPQEAAAQADATVVPPTVAAASTLDALTARQEALNQELQAAYAEMDFEKAGLLQVESLGLIEKKTAAAAAKAQAEAAETREFDAKVARAEAEALRLYPSAGAANSPLHARMEALYKSMEATDDPLLYNPDCTLKLAQMAAAQLNIGPVVAIPAPVAAAQAAPSPRALTNVRPAAGGQVSGAAPAAQQDELVAASANWSPEEWEAWRENARSKR